MKRIIALAAVLAGAALAGAADTYAIDRAHSAIGFSVKHLMVSNTKGEFKDFDGTWRVDLKDISKSSIEVTIQAASIDTRNEDRDKHLRAADFLDAEKFPTLSFKSTKIVKKGEGYEASGELTIKGVTKPIKIPFILNGPVKDPWAGTRIGIEGGLTINRQDFGVNFSKLMDNGGLVVGDEVKIDLALEGLLDSR